jgi:hypothetical protein
MCPAGVEPERQEDLGKGKRRPKQAVELLTPAELAQAGLVGTGPFLWTLVSKKIQANRRLLSEQRAVNDPPVPEEDP